MPIAYDVLEAALAEAVDMSLRQLIAQVDPHDLYAVGLYTGGELSYLALAANTRSALTASPSSPWSPPDWALHLYADESFQPVNAALSAGWTDDFQSFEIDQVRVRQAIHHVLRAARQRFFSETSVVMGLFMGGLDHPWSRPL